MIQSAAEKIPSYQPVIESDLPFEHDIVSEVYLSHSYFMGNLNIL